MFLVLLCHSEIKNEVLVLYLVLTALIQWTENVKTSIPNYD